MSTLSTQTVVVPDAAHGQRLDRWLSSALPDRSRSEVQRWIKQGLVRIDGAPARASHKVERGQAIQIAIPTTETTTLQAEAIALNIVYEDDDMLVIDKPAGMVVHPALGHSGGTLVNAILHHAPDIQGVGGEQRPGLVHRLDKETSGLIVVAKHDRAMRHLQEQFSARTVYKEYLALLEGRVEPPIGRINAPLGRHPVHRQRQAVLLPDPRTGESKGRAAITDYRTLGSYSAQVHAHNNYANFTLISAILHTGRTHQIRVHCAWLKHPVVGDTVYGYRKQRLPLNRHFLHAHILRLRLPHNDQEREFVSPLAAELQTVLQQLAEA